jgi:hypothetical protein
MNKVYDHVGAERLIPLLRSIQKELRERADAIRRLRVLLGSLSPAQRHAGEYFALQAELATHKLETRLALKEIRRLGCSIDESDPHRILIPGSSESAVEGWSWSFGEAGVRTLAA